MKKLSNKLSMFVYILTLPILLFLTFESFRYSFGFSLTDYQDSTVSATGDSVLLNTIVCIVIFIVFFFILENKKIIFLSTAKISCIISIIIPCCIFVGLTLWICLSDIPPYWDQMQVYLDAKSFSNGDYTSMTQMYLRMYPQQYGLIFFESFLLRIWDSYKILQIFNAMCISISVHFAYRITNDIAKDRQLGIASLLLLPMFIPYLYYVSFVYGDVFFSTSMLISFWLITRYVIENRRVYFICTIILSCIMIPVRKNALIFLIAVFIYLFINFLLNKKIKCLLFGVSLITVPILFSAFIPHYYEMRSGVKLEKEHVPAISWIAMGLQGDVYDNSGVGYYNGFNQYSFVLNDYNTEKTKEYAKEFLREQLLDFKRNPNQCADFIKFKINEQWIDPMFAFIQMTVGGDGEYNNIDVLYNSSFLAGLYPFINAFQSFIYLFALIGCVFSLIKQNNNYNVLYCLTFLGGFIFSIIWEASGRYVFPFFVLLIVFSLQGIKYMAEAVNNLICKRIIKK